MLKVLGISLMVVMVNISSAFAYVGNMNTGKFHEDYCPSVRQMYEHNKHYTYDRDELVDDGYVPCRRCNP